jgi:transglutaminase-like putative cysteine protease/type II secretory pathway pseudopilin PulG
LSTPVKTRSPLPGPLARPLAGPLPAALAGPFTGLATALIAAATGWFALLSWRGMAEEPSRYLGPLLTAAILVAVVGWGVRRVTARYWLALLAQVVVLAIWLLHRVSGHWLPTLGSVKLLFNELGDGALAAQRYASPVSVDHPEFHLLLLVGGIGVLLGVDLICCGLRRASLAGLPLLLTITISASVLLEPVGALVFLATAFGWLALVAMQETSRLGTWGRGSGGTRLSAVGGLSTRIAVSCGVIAVVLTGALSSTGRTFGSFGQGDGVGSITVANPLLDLRRNLRETRDVPLVSVTTEDSNPSYLRLTVLDDFTGSTWQPSDRDVDSTGQIEGQLPPPPGLDPTAEGPDHTWRVTVSESFASKWLPLPYPSTRLDVGDDWRYDPDTLDVVGVGSTNAAGLSYSVTTFSPTVVAEKVRLARTPPASLRARMTDLPSGLPPIFQKTAERITKGATNDFDRAVLLQDWFRSAGGFTYSTDPAPGSGIRTLERFITTDRVGYCEQFSAAMAVMARTLHIPARVAVGFLRSDPVNGQAVFSSHDLHAWPELYFEGVGWIRFEPTPSDRTDSAPAYTTALVPISPDNAPSDTSSASAQPSQAKPTVAPVDAGKGAAANNQQSWTWLLVLLGVLLVLALLAAPRLLRSTSSRRRWATARTNEALADAAWSEVRATAVDLELGWSDRNTVRANGREVQRAVIPPLAARDAINEVMTFVELTRYARPRELSRDHRERLQRDVATWQDAMFEAVDKRRARRARWWPKSVNESVRRITTPRRRR